MTALSRDAILGAADLGVVEVAVPEWGGVVRVRGLSGAERDAFEASMLVTRGDKVVRTNVDNLRARLVVLACVDDEGNRLFRDEDAQALGAKSAAALERVFNVAQRLSGLTEADMEELAEGFGDAPS